MKTSRVLIFVLALLAIAMTPVSGIAVVDGDPGEWDLSATHFAAMYEAGDPGKEELGDLFLQYDCTTNTLSALVLLREGFEISPIAEDAFLKLNDNVIVDGTYPDFAWVGTVGFEASAIVQPASYSLNTHIQALPDRTVAVKDRSIILELDCTPTAITLSSFAGNSSTNAGIALWLGLVILIAAGFIILIRRKNIV